MGPVSIELAADRGGDLIGELPILNDGLPDAGVPLGQELIPEFGISVQFRVPWSPRKDIDLSNIVDKPGQHGLIGPNAALLARDGVRQRRDLGTFLPVSFQIGADMHQRGRSKQLPSRVGERCCAHVLIPDPRDGQL